MPCSYNPKLKACFCSAYFGSFLSKKLSNASSLQSYCSQFYTMFENHPKKSHFTTWATFTVFNFARIGGIRVPTLKINLTRFARIVAKWDIFGTFQTLYLTLGINQQSKQITYLGMQMVNNVDADIGTESVVARSNTSTSTTVLMRHWGWPFSRTIVETICLRRRYLGIGGHIW